MSESEFQFGKDHSKCGTCGFCLHAHEENPKLKAMCDAAKASGVKLKKHIEKLSKGDPFAMTNKSFVKSLNPASATLYVPAQVRATKSEAIKFQGEGSMELETYADAKIVEWLKKQPATMPSVAGTGVMYTVCQAIAHDKADPKVKEFAGPVRIQIKGPALNRDWGAEFVVDHPQLRAWAEQFAQYLKTKGEPEVEKIVDEAKGKSLLDNEDDDNEEPEEE